MNATHWASIPDLAKLGRITIACDETWGADTGDQFRIARDNLEVFIAPDGTRYTWDDSAVTCEACLAKLANVEPFL